MTTLTRTAAVLSLLALVAACPSSSKEKEKDNDKEKTPAAQPPGPQGATNEGQPPDLDGGLPPAPQQEAAPCEMHVDGSDADHKVFPVEAVTRTTHADGKTTLEIVLLDTTGACDFPKTKPLSYHAFTARITVPGNVVKPGRYEITKGGTEVTAALVSGAGPTPERRIPAAGGFLDLYSVKGSTDTDAPALSGGFTLVDPAGSSYGCFNATRCLPPPAVK